MRYVFLFFIFFTSFLYAHKINIFAHDEKGILFIHAYFTQSSSCQDCDVIVIDKNEKILATSRTNHEGKTSLTLPKTSFNILVKASMGHQNQLSYNNITPKDNIHTSAILQNNHEHFGWKILLALVMIAVLFGALTWLKRKR